MRPPATKSPKGFHPKSLAGGLRLLADVGASAYLPLKNTTFQLFG